ncbi:MAG: DNA polymerase-4 [Chlamydiales bacterium]|jgi:DNA polymerase-4
MDAFYASIEQRDNPSLKGKPVIVGGDPRSRGVVAACSYEARKYGVHSAMSSSQAYRLCPDAIFLPSRFDQYRVVSQEIMEIFFDYTDLVEPLSLDEAYLDVTENKRSNPSATFLAVEIRETIFKRTGLTASTGVSYNKFLAKVASDINKPNGSLTITPEESIHFLNNLAIRKFYGIGKVTEEKMKRMGICTGGDLKKYEKEELIYHFGKAGQYYYEVAHGIDDRPVNPCRERKSIGKETTLSQDLDDVHEMMMILKGIAENLELLLKRKLTKGITVTLKIKYADFSLVTRSVTLPKAVNESSIIINHISKLLEKTEAGERKVRLLGISISHLFEKGGVGRSELQLEFPFMKELIFV